MKILPEDLEYSFGSKIPKEIELMLKNCDLEYEIVHGKEFEQVVLNTLKMIENDSQKVGAPYRKKVWEKGWSENLEAFKQSKDINDIIPKFLRPEHILRFRENYIKARSTSFELDFVKIFQQWFFKNYMKGFDHIYEFGCGSGFNLVAIGEKFPSANLYGMDFVKSSVDLIEKISSATDLKLTGKLFDMLSPDKTLKLHDNSCVFTFGAIEQLAGKFHNFMNFLLNQDTQLYLHVEPTIELYDPNKLFDYLAIKFQRQRGYSEGFLPYLQKLEKDRVIDLIAVKRLYFGNSRAEAYNYMVWRKHESGTTS